MKNNNKGFSLVELIVVIAIMAILAAVAVVGFSMYIPKAQQASDKQMVGDIEYVLSLHAQSNPEDLSSGYVVLTTGDAQASSGFVTDVLVATYGENWAKELKLAYGEWTSESAMLEYALENYDSANTVANSTFLTDASTDGMMSALTTLTGVATQVIQGHEDDATDILTGMGLTDVADKLAALENEGLSPDDPDYATAISNLLVGHFSGNMTSDSVQVNGSLEQLALDYATFYAYSEYVGDPSIMTSINEKLADVESTGALTSETLLSGVPQEHISGYSTYMSTMEENGIDNADAFLSMMGAMNKVSQTYTDIDSLTSADLYESASVKNQVDNYVNAVRLVAGMNEQDVEKMLSLVGEGTIVIMITSDGVISTSPDVQ